MSKIKIKYKILTNEVYTTTQEISSEQDLHLVIRQFVCDKFAIVYREDGSFFNLNVKGHINTKVYHNLANILLWADGALQEIPDLTYSPEDSL